MNKKKYNLSTFFIAVACIIALIGTTYHAISTHINLGLDLRGGFEILYEVTPLNEGDTVDMTAVTNSISKRVNVMGVSEPQITVEGNNRIRVQLAGVEDQETARQMLGTTANLTFRDINDNELADSSIVTEGGASLGYQDGKPVVSLKIADPAKFGEITKQVAAMTSGENLMVIWLDYQDGDTYKAEAEKAAQGQEPKYISVASVTKEITGDCIISGNFTDTEAKTLANLINSGSLPVKMTEISSNVVSAQYGNDALQKTAVAGILGVCAVILFMIWAYRMPGIISAIMLAVYIWSIFGIYALIGAVFTLPGIGALVLGVGMTVDANIITFERTKQELYKGRSIQAAVAEGQKLSFGTIFDAQFTTLLAGLIMYWWGNGTVKGFATMLIITVIMTLVLNVAFSRFLLNSIVRTGIADNKLSWFGVKPEQIPDVQNGQEQFYFSPIKKVDWLGKSKYLIRVSLSIFAAALVCCIIYASNGKGAVNLGIDFASGTKLTITSSSPITIDEVSKEMTSIGYKDFSYQAAGDSTVYATTKQSLTTDDLTTIKSAFKDLYGQEPGDNVVTPVVGRDLVRNAVILTIVAWIAMMLYITFRYQWDYGVSCIVALMHDVLMVLSFFAIFRFEVNIELISVLLTIIGYSINNAIVVFDRIRENVGKGSIKRSPESYHKIINDSIDDTFLMALYSSITTILPVIFLLAVGSNAIFTFTFAMFVGLISGTFSAIFIAPAMWFWIRTHYQPKEKKKAKKAKREKLDEYTIKGINA